ncbi:MAG: hypothetical protein LBJ63_11480 [Prevotellaceae bacterium]|jgi:uncharacterized protein RhaS with RHS repeats|nr:hypothetical protein [Prevotellaceae bacterium]
MLETEFGRWLSPDPLAEKYYSISPYAFCGNNPINRIDPDGRADIWYNGKVIGNDGVNDDKIYTIRTEAITNSDVKETVKYVKANSGNTEAFQNSDIVWKNTIEIESSTGNRQAMVNEVNKDNGKGGTAQGKSLLVQPVKVFVKF